MKKRIYYALMALISITSVSLTQIPRTSIVEHFTNTSCSVCANNNAGIYNTINTHKNTLHISFHPSSPYTSDVFSQQNKVENNDRTNFYGVFGSTPRLVVNGMVIQNSALNTTLSNASSMFTNFEFKIQQEQVSLTDFNVRLVVKKVANDTTTTAVLFLGVMEDTINKTTNNGEPFHYNVFRKSISATIGNTVPLPLNVGDSTVLNYNFKSISFWNINRIHTIGILQNQDKSLINSAKSVNTIEIPSGVNNLISEEGNSIFYPNPIKGNVVHSNLDLNEIRIYNIVGGLIKYIEHINKNEVIALKDMQPGHYIFTAKGKNTIYTQKLIFQ